MIEVLINEIKSSEAVITRWEETLNNQGMHYRNSVEFNKFNSVIDYYDKLNDDLALIQTDILDETDGKSRNDRLNVLEPIKIKLEDYFPCFTQDKDILTTHFLKKKFKIFNEFGSAKDYEGIEEITQKCFDFFKN